MPRISLRSRERWNTSPASQVSGFKNTSLESSNLRERSQSSGGAEIENKHFKHPQIPLEKTSAKSIYVSHINGDRRQPSQIASTVSGNAMA